MTTARYSSQRQHRITNTGSQTRCAECHRSAGDVSRLSISSKCRRFRIIRVIQRQLSVSFGENYLCFIFRHFPQHQIYAQAQHAGEAVQAATVQSQFWQMHGMPFIHQQELENGYLVEYANNQGLDISNFCKIYPNKYILATSMKTSKVDTTVE